MEMNMNRDGFIKKKFQEDNYISDKANNVFDNFMKSIANNQTNMKNDGINNNQINMNNYNSAQNQFNKEEQAIKQNPANMNIQGDSQNTHNNVTNFINIFKIIIQFKRNIIKATIIKIQTIPMLLNFLVKIRLIQKIFFTKK